MTDEQAEDPYQDPTLRALRDRIADLKGGVLVAFSGGVDSALLLKVCVDVHGDRALAVTANSASLPDHDRRDAIRVAEAIGARHRFIDTDEMSDDRYRKNDKDRCYFCKHTLFESLTPIASKLGFPHLLFGANKDDQGDFRPGHRAAAEHSVKAPMMDEGIGKDEVRRLARLLDVPVWDKPASACLASRVPYGTSIDPTILSQVDRAEQRIRALGFGQCRVRHHGDVARIEVPKEDLIRAISIADEIQNAVREVGYLHVTIDLGGYESGNLNRALSRPSTRT